MKMQDKELDDVFRAQLEGFEAEPSEKVWTGIDGELNSAGRRKIWIPILRIAAVFVVMVSVGVVFILRRDNVIIADGHPSALNTKLQPVVQPQKTSGQVTEVIPAVQPAAVKKNESKRIENTIAHVTVDHKVQPEIAKTETPAVQSPVQEVIKPKEQEVIAAVSTPIEIKPAVVPDSNVPLTNKLLDAKATIVKAKPAAVITQAVAVDSAKRLKHRGIHSFGDLVNVLASKVDKKHGSRMIDDDDSDSAVAMINRGMQKVSSDREK